MTTIDWLIVGLTILLAFWGYAQGLIVSALSLAGFAAGAFAGTRLAPLLLEEGSRSPYGPMFGLVGALVVGSIVAIALEALGSSIRQRLMLTPLAVADGIGGAVLVAALGLGLTWIAGAAALQTPGAGELRREIQRSAILRKLNDLLPPSGSILNALARVDPFPRITGPAAGVPPPTRGVLADRDVRAARASVVRIQGTACGLGVEGSGWAAGGQLVVTNAHVVAGQDDTTVEPDGGGDLDADVAAFDPRNDVAVLRVDGLAAPALGQSTNASVGAPVGILGYPEDGPYHAEPGRLGPTQTVISEDAYGSGPIQRRITAIRGEVRPGNSGGPAVDRRGRVVATIFAAASRGPRTGFGVPPDQVAANLRKARASAGAVDSGPCVR